MRNLVLVSIISLFAVACTDDKSSSGGGTAGPEPVRIESFVKKRFYQNECTSASLVLTSQVGASSETFYRKEIFYAGGQLALTVREYSDSNCYEPINMVYSFQVVPSPSGYDLLNYDSDVVASFTAEPISGQNKIAIQFSKELSSNGVNLSGRHELEALAFVHSADIITSSQPIDFSSDKFYSQFTQDFNCSSSADNNPLNAIEINISKDIGFDRKMTTWHLAVNPHDSRVYLAFEHTIVQNNGQPLAPTKGSQKVFNWEIDKINQRIALEGAILAQPNEFITINLIDLDNNSDLEQSGTGTVESVNFVKVNKSLFCK